MPERHQNGTISDRLQEGRNGTIHDLKSGTRRASYADCTPSLASFPRAELAQQRENYSKADAYIVVFIVVSMDPNLLLARNWKMNDKFFRSGICRPGDWNRIHWCNSHRRKWVNCKIVPVDREMRGFRLDPGATDASSSPPVMPEQRGCCPQGLGAGDKEHPKMPQSGTVKFFNHAKGFGFITPEGGDKDVFVHISAVQASGLPGLEDGQKVTFETEPDKRGKGPKAVNLTVL